MFLIKQTFRLQTSHSQTYQIQILLKKLNEVFDDEPIHKKNRLQIHIS